MNRNLTSPAQLAGVLCAALMALSTLACTDEPAAPKKDSGSTSGADALVDSGSSGGTSSGGTSSGGASSGSSGADVTGGNDIDTSKPQTWSILVYMAADNNLEKSGILDIEEMLAITASSHVRFYVETDRADGFYQLGLQQIDAWTGTKRLIVHEGKVAQLSDLGETNMGAAKSLSDFITWALGQHKSDKNVLVLWNHGMAWQGFGGDDFDNDQMTLDEIDEGISVGMKAAGLSQFDLAGFDACLMGDLVVARMLGKYAPYIIASEDLEPSHGWNYGAFNVIAKNSHTSVVELGKAIVQAYKIQAKEQKRQHSITMALHDVSKLPALVGAWDAFTAALDKAISGKKPGDPALSAVAKARSKVQRFGRSATPIHDYQMVDIRDLVSRLAKLDASFKPHEEAIDKALKALVVDRVDGPLTKGANGLSVYFPEVSKLQLPTFSAIPDMDGWRKVLTTFQAAGDAAANNAPKFSQGKCPPGKQCNVGGANAQPSCDDEGDLGAAQVLDAKTVADAIDAHMLVGYLGSDGEPSVVARVPATIDSKTGKVDAKWQQDVLTIMQGGRSAMLFAETAYDGVMAYHEVPMVVSGPAKCPCVLPGDGGWWDTDGDGAANCVDLDDDNDGIKDSDDNCPFVPNADQATSTTAGVGAACSKDSNAPKLKCQPDAANPYGEERAGVLHVRTHQVKGGVESYAFFVQGIGGISEHFPKSGLLMRPMVLQPVQGTGWTWVKGPPLPMRLDQPLEFTFKPLELTFPDDPTGLPKQDGKGNVVKMTQELGVGDIFLQLQVEGLGKHGDGVFWQGDKDKDIDGAKCEPKAPAYCKAGEVVDCDGGCWPQARWGDPVCDAGQDDKTPNFFCEALAWDKLACAAPPCPGGGGKLRDCLGRCIATADMKGNGVCHDGSELGEADLVCPQWDHDSGDCVCGKSCNSHGECNDDPKAGKVGCTCKDGWTGAYCDIPPTCGNKACEGAERCFNCPSDCGECGKQACGDGTCSKALGENCDSCAADCGACSCGDGWCQPGKEDCSSCAKDCGACPVCGDEVCETWSPLSKFPKAKGERCDNCPGDCGACQGNCCIANEVKGGSFAGGGCSDAATTKCVCDKDPDCCIVAWTKACVALAEKDCALNCCVPSCAGKECGSDGCGGTCGGCDDGNPCTKDACGTDGKCLFTAAPGPCNDGDPCTATSSCQGGKCEGKGNKCDDGDPCTQDSCDKGKCAFVLGKGCDDNNVCTSDTCSADGSSCVHSNTNEGGQCDDGDACTSGDLCKAGKCGGPTAVQCDDGNVCTDDACNKALGCVHDNNKAACDDNDACTNGDVCSGGKCASGQVIGCDDNEVCTNDICDPAKGCVFEPKAATCTDSDACTANDACKDGKCAAGPAVKCDDGNPCTDDTCDKNKGCANAANTAACTDNDACTDKDVCKDGTCTAGAALKCDDGNPCTDDTCDKAKGCQNAANSASCDDSSKCTAADKCSGGKCSGTAVKCDDGNPCTADSCDPGGGCMQSVHSPGPKCEDGDACTKDDKCDDSKGLCVGGGTVDCNDANPCTTDSCDPKKGCAHTNNTAACDDGDACTGSDACKDGKCGGAKTKCNDGNPCTDDSCDAKTGCVSLANSATCTDNDACTNKDTCSKGACTPGPALSCDDGNVCTTDSCDKTSGCATAFRGIGLGKQLFALGYDGSPIAATGDVLYTDQGLFVARGTSSDGWHARYAKQQDESWMKDWEVDSSIVSLAVGPQDVVVGATDSGFGTIASANGQFSKKFDFKTSNVASITMDKDGKLWAAGADLRRYDYANGNQLLQVPKSTVDPSARPAVAAWQDNVLVLEKAEKKYLGGNWTRIKKLDLTGKVVATAEFEAAAATTLKVAESGLLLSADPAAGRVVVLSQDLKVFSHMGNLKAEVAGTGDDGRLVTLWGKTANVKQVRGHEATEEDCQDNDQCTQDKCQGGACKIKAADCDDGDACTVDSCDKAKGCNNAPALEGASCDDGSPCTTADQCVQGQCSGVSKQCPAGSQCAQNGASAGQCVDACGNGQKDGDETDVDCGGSCFGKCAANKICTKNADCATGSCANGKCGAPNEIVVTSAAATGPGTFVDAVTQANKTAEADRITFKIGTGAKTITLTTFPSIERDTIIDGSTQPSDGNSNRITITGNAALMRCAKKGSLPAPNMWVRSITVKNGSYAIYALTCGDVAVDDVDGSSDAKDPTGAGVICSSCSAFTATNSVFKNRTKGISLSAAQSVRIEGVDLTGSGHSQYATQKGKEPTIGVNNSGYKRLRIRDVKFSATNGIHFDASSLHNMTISGDAKSGAAIIFERSKGFGTGYFPMRISSASNLTLTDLDLSATDKSDSSYGVIVGGTTLTVTKLKVQNRISGIYVNSSSKDVTIKDCDLVNSGATNGYAVTIRDAKPNGKVPGGLLMTGNKFGGTGGGIKLEGTQNEYVIGPKAETGTHIVLDPTTGIGDVDGTSIEANNVKKVTIKNVDLSRAGQTRAGTGIKLYAPQEALVEGCTISGRKIAVLAEAPRNSTLKDNKLGSSGESVTEGAITIKSMVFAHSGPTLIATGNTFGDNSNVHLAMVQTQDYSIANAPGTGVQLVLKRSEGFGKAQVAAVALDNVKSTTIKGLNLSWAGSGKKGDGVYIKAATLNVQKRETGVTLTNLSINNRVNGVHVVEPNQLYDTVEMTCSQLTNNDVGVLLNGKATISSCQFGGNTAALKHVFNNKNYQKTVAQSNWWGAADGPKPNGNGDANSGGANYMDVTKHLTTIPSCSAPLCLTDADCNAGKCNAGKCL